MRLNKTEREVLRKWVEIVIPQMSKLEMFNRRFPKNKVLFTRKKDLLSAILKIILRVNGSLLLLKKLIVRQ